MFLSKRPPLLLTVGAALLLIGGGAVAYWGLSRRNTLAQNLPVGVQAVPEDAVMAFSLSTDEAEWRRLRQFGTPKTQEQFDQFLAKWRDRILTDNGLTFAADIEPWVGPEVTVAVLPDQEGTDTEPTPLPLPEDVANTLMIVPIADPAEAQARFSAQIERSQAGAAQDYKGVAIQPLAGAEGTTLYAAVLGTELVVLSNQFVTVERSIDAFKGGKSLVDLPGLNRSFEQLKGSAAFSRFYINVPSAVQTLASTSQPLLPPAQLETFKTDRGLVGAINLEARGVRLESVSWLPPGTDQTFPQDNGTTQLTQRVPTEALLFASGGNFQRFWEDLKAGQSLASLLPIDPENLSVSLQAATGLTLEEDLLPWTQGEFALGILAPPQASAATPDQEALPNPALVLMLKASDRKAAETTLAQLNEVMETRYRYAVNTADLKGVAVTRWTSPFQSLAMSYGWLEGDVVFLSLGEGIESAIAPLPRQSLAQNSLFQLTTTQAPRVNNGHFFLNLKAMAEAQNNLLLPPLPQDGIIASQAVEGIGVTATALGERQVRYDLFVALNRGNRPGDLPQLKDATPNPDPDASPNASPDADPDAAPETEPTPETSQPPTDE
ncbi:DUF3352 domain-containing protein [Pseudanabaena sp. FACHB-2040]|uniref:DUF3352 domain-containing protein n=1 Tax=Pseudanabaena sp. FACHB-2040 TaxID=2692859 RepID=UPI0016864265|nr:DUF3352 domain-containing protein [Pseudanabaena sp. FACHB-2040]MBD2256416.1 DUF3352 domain-containing protein [Pseudanabaena sp. FACHB-2040]